MIIKTPGFDLEQITPAFDLFNEIKALVEKKGGKMVTGSEFGDESDRMPQIKMSEYSPQCIYLTVQVRLPSSDSSECSGQLNPQEEGTH